jgi:hypothetical protein
MIMRILFLPLLLVASFIVSQQATEPGTPGLVILKFHCGRYERGSGMIRSVQDPGAAMNEPISIQQQKNEPQEIKNRRDMQERRAEMQASEINAALSNRPQSKLYFYRLQVQNASAKAVKSFAWEYQPAAQSDLNNRQFYCILNAKPNEKKDYELVSPLAPSRVVNAAKLGDKPDSENGRVVVNKIEFTDGTEWHRAGWNPLTFAPEDTNKVARGKCIGI